MSTLNIVARFVVTDSTRESVKASILKCAVSSQKEEGNNYYELTESVLDPNVFVIIEEWKSQEAIDFHNSTSHFKELIESINGKAEISIDILKAVT